MRIPFVFRKTAEEAQNRLEELNQEYQNYRRRCASSREDGYRQGRFDTVKELLPVYDNLLRALEQPCGDEAFVSGIRMTLDQMKKTLEQMDIREIPALGETFDPKRHEAMDHIEDPDQGENIVTKVILTGFYQGETVLRHALVVVAN